jgi:hypothetical protein
MRDAPDRHDALVEVEARYVSWLEERLEQLAGAKALGEVRRSHYELVAVLMA